MADGVPITAGSGTTIATDDCGAPGHAQLVKLAISTDGSATLIPAEASNGLDVDVTRVQGSVTVAQGTSASLNCTEASASDIRAALELIDDSVFADDAGFTAGSNKVSMAGVLTVAHGSNPDAADANDAVAALANRHRVPFVIGGHPNVITSSARITGSNTDTALAPTTVASGTKIVLTRLSITVSNATTVNVGVKIGFGAATITADSTTGAAGVVIDNDGFPPGGGINVGDGSGMIAVGGDGEELRITNDAPTTGAIHVSYSYYTIES